MKDWILFFIFLVGCAQEITDIPIEPTNVPRGTVDIFFYDNIYGDRFSESEKSQMFAYTERIRAALDVSERWIIQAVPFSDLVWVGIYGSTGGCGGTAFLEPDATYTRKIWIGIVRNSQRCLTAWQRHPEFWYIRDYPTMHQKEIDHEFRCHVLPMANIQEEEDSCFLG